MVRYVETTDTNGYLGGGVQVSNDSHACQPMAVDFVLDTQVVLTVPDEGFSFESRALPPSYCR